MLSFAHHTHACTYLPTQTLALLKLHSLMKPNSHPSPYNPIPFPALARSLTPSLPSKIPFATHSLSFFNPSLE